MRSRAALRLWWALVFVSAVLVRTQHAQAQPATFLALSSDPGDPVGAGRTLLYTTANGGFTGSAGPAGFSIHFSGNAPAYEYWFLDFYPLAGRTLTPGVYEGANRGSNPTAHPGLNVWGSGGTGCNASAGRFLVLEASYGSSGEVLSFAADFEQHCNGLTPALHGSIRWASAIPTGARLSVSDAVTYEGDGEPKSLRFVVSLSAPSNVPVSVDYATADASAQGGRDYTPVTGTAVFAPGQTAVEVLVPVLGNTTVEGDRAMALVLSNASGAPIAFGQGTGRILEDDAGRTYLRFASDPGDTLGGGRTFTLTPLDGDIRASQYTYGNFETSFQFNGDEHWSLEFIPAGSGGIVPGTYENVTGTYPNYGPGAHLEVSGPYGCSFSTGRFVVHEASYGSNGEVLRFSADYEYHCGGATPALRGSVRYQSTLDATPRVSVGSRTVYEGDGEPVTLPFWISLSTPSAGPVTVPYATADGTGKSGTDYLARSGVADFPAGTTSVRIDVPVIGNHVVQLDRTVRLLLGTPTGAPVAFGESVGTIADDDAGRSYLHYESVPGGVGGGTTATWTPVDGTFTGFGDASSFRVAYNGAHRWDMTFAPPSGGALAPGLYEYAASYPQVWQPRIDLAMDNSSCSGNGRFIVREWAMSGGQVTRFAVDFAWNCGSVPGPLLGSLRYNTTIPITTFAPTRMGFYPLPPCRILDTRESNDAMGGSTTRSVAGVGTCGIPFSAKALVANVTVTGATAPGELRFSVPGAVPPASTLSFPPDRTRANNALIPVSVGEFQVRNQSPADSWLDFLVDVSGYFQ